MKLPPLHAHILKIKIAEAKQAGAREAVAAIAAQGGRLTFADGPQLKKFLKVDPDVEPDDDRIQPDALKYLIQAMLAAKPGGADAVLSEFQHRAADHSKTMEDPSSDEADWIDRGDTMPADGDVPDLTEEDEASLDEQIHPGANLSFADAPLPPGQHVNGERKDKRGYRRCYHEGRLVKCPERPGDKKDAAPQVRGAGTAASAPGPHHAEPLAPDHVPHNRGWMNMETGRVRYGERPKEKSDDEKRKRHAERESQAALPVMVGGGTGSPSVAEKLFGSPEMKAFAAVSGAGNGAHAYVHSPFSGSSSARVSLDHPYTRSWSRTIIPKADGTFHVHNDHFFLKPKFQGNGFGMKAFTAQVRECFAKGADSISTCAGKGLLDGQRMNGYYTWAKLGYDADLAAVGVKVPAQFAGCKTVQDLMKTKEGSDFWKAKGVMFSAKFDLTPGSASLQALDRYLVSKGQPPIDQSPAAGSARMDAIEERRDRMNEEPPDKKTVVAGIEKRFRDEYQRAQLPDSLFDRWREFTVGGQGELDTDRVENYLRRDIKYHLSSRNAQSLHSSAAPVRRQQILDFAQSYGQPIDPAKLDASAASIANQSPSANPNPDRMALWCYAEAYFQELNLPYGTPEYHTLTGKLFPPGGLPLPEPKSTFSDASPVLRFSVAWDETRHPRMDKGTPDGGEFVSGAAIAEARHDPAEAARLRSVVTNPEERAKLDAQLGMPKTAGLSVTGQKGLQHATETHAHISKLVAKATGGEAVGIDDLKGLANALNRHTVGELDQLRQAVGIRAGGLKVEQINTLIDRAVGAHIAGYVPVTSGDGRAPGERKGRASREPRPVRERMALEDKKREDGTPINPIPGIASGSAAPGAAGSGSAEGVGHADSTPLNEATPHKLKAGVLHNFEDLLREKYHHVGVVPVAEIKAEIAKQFGPKADVDGILQDLRRSDHLRLIDDDRGGFHAEKGESFNLPSESDRPKVAPDGSAAPTPEKLAGGIKSHIAAMIEDGQTNGGMVSIPKIRDEIEKEFGPQAASHKVFDEAMHDLRRSGEIRMIPVDDKSRHAKDELTKGISAGVGLNMHAEQGDKWTAPEPVAATPDANPSESPKSSPASPPEPAPDTQAADFAEKFRAAVASGDKAAVHDLTTSALKGEHGADAQQRVSHGVDQHSAKKGRGLKAKNKAILDSLTAAEKPGEQPEPADAPLADFASKVQAITDKLPDHRGDTGPLRQLFIHHVYAESQKDPAFPKMGLEEFKDKLVEANKARHLSLGRADLVQAFHPDDIANAETKHLNSTFHFINPSRPKSDAKPKALPKTTPAVAPDSTPEHEVRSIRDGDKIIHGVYGKDGKRVGPTFGTKEEAEAHAAGLNAPANADGHTDRTAERQKAISAAKKTIEKPTATDAEKTAVDDAKAIVAEKEKEQKADDVASGKEPTPSAEPDRTTAMDGKPVAQSDRIHGKPELAGETPRAINWARGIRKKELDSHAGTELEPHAHDYFEGIKSAHDIIEQKDNHGANIRTRAFPPTAESGSAEAIPEAEKPADTLPPQAEPVEAPTPKPTLRKAPVRPSLNDFFKPDEALKSGGGLQGVIDEDIAAANDRKAKADETERARIEGLYKKPLAEHLAGKSGVSKGKLGTQQTTDKLVAENEHRQSVEDAMKAGKPVSPEVMKDYPDIAAAPKETEGAKAPHEMNGEELLQLLDDVRAGKAGKLDIQDTTKDAFTEFKKLHSIREGGKYAWDRSAKDAAESQHRAAVKSAMSAGLPVPPEVMKDYPGLKAADPSPELEKARDKAGKLKADADAEQAAQAKIPPVPLGHAAIGDPVEEKAKRKAKEAAKPKAAPPKVTKITKEADGEYTVEHADGSAHTIPAADRAEAMVKAKEEHAAAESPAVPMPESKPSKKSRAAKSPKAEPIAPPAPPEKPPEPPQPVASAAEEPNHDAPEPKAAAPEPVDPKSSSTPRYVQAIADLKAVYERALDPDFTEAHVEAVLDTMGEFNFDDLHKVMLGVGFARKPKNKADALHKLNRWVMDRKGTYERSDA